MTRPFKVRLEQEVDPARLIESVELDAFGLAVMRPIELLKLYELYWKALDEEFMRRRTDTQR